MVRFQIIAIIRAEQVQKTEIDALKELLDNLPYSIKKIQFLKTEVLLEESGEDEE